MKAKKVTRQSKRRLIIFGTISVGIVVTFLATFVFYALHIYQLEEQEKKLGAELVSLQEKGSNLKTEIQKLKDPDYVARYARENYLYSKNGEYVIRIDKTPNVDPIILKKGINGWYWVLFGGIVSLIFITFICKKKNKVLIK